MKRREKSTMKKTLAILLSLALVICMIPATAVTAYAAPVDLSKATVTVNPSTVVYTGMEQQPEVTVKLGDTTLTAGTDYDLTWDEENHVNVKKYTVTATGKGTAESGYSGTATGTFEITKRDLSSVNFFIPVQEDAENTDLAEQIEKTITFEDATDKNIKLNLTNDIKIEVKDNGSDKNSKIAVINPVGSNLTGSSKEIIFAVKPGISNYTVCGVVSKEYTGEAITQSGAFLGTKDSSGKEVSANISTSYYQLKYENNVNAGTASVKAVARDPYVGETKAVQFIITQASAEKAYRNGKLKVSDISDKPLNSQPEVTVSEYVSGKWNTLSSSTYNISYEGNDKVGTAYVKITFGSDSNYYGTISKAFTVVSNDKNVETMTVYRGSKQLTSTSTLPAAYVYRGVSQPVSDITVYTDYANRKTLSTSYYDVVYEYTDEKGKVISTTSPTDAKKYDVYIAGKNGYAGKQKIGTYNIPPFDIKNTTISVSIASATSIPNVTVRSSYDNITFVKDKDYTVNTGSYVSNGRVLVTISPIATGNLKGSPRSDYYSIVARSISSCRVYFANGRNSASYTGSSIIVDVRVEDGYYNTLRERTDYTISYKLNGKTVSTIKDAGVYTIEIKGLNGYTGTTSLTFTVLGTDISSYTVTLKESSVNATGYNQTPTILSVKRGYYTLSSGDYTVSYQDESGAKVKLMKAPGTYKVVVTGKNGYSGSTYATFTIIGKAQSITGVASSYKAYPGGEVIQLYPKATEGRFTYTSSDSTVATVSASGLVTPLKAGRAKITIKTTGTTTYDPATYSTVIKVYPKKAVMTKKPWNYGKKGQVKVRWYKQDNVTRYEIRYSRAKNFAKGTYITKKVNAAQNDYTTQSTTIKNLKSGQRYYVKVRAVKEVYNDYGKKLTYYGKWSGWKSVVVK